MVLCWAFLFRCLCHKSPTVKILILSIIRDGLPHNVKPAQQLSQTKEFLYPHSNGFVSMALILKKTLKAEALTVPVFIMKLFRNRKLVTPSTQSLYHRKAPGSEDKPALFSGGSYEYFEMDNAI